MMTRDYSYDYLRAFAAIMIVLCHICQGFGISAELGYYLGGTYVDVFLLLSAYLLGLTSRNKIADNPWQFMRKRCYRIIPTYYSFLTINFIIILVLIGWNSLSVNQVIGHYLFLNWFWKASRVCEPPLPQIGHLWFMSCIIFGYLSVVAWSMVANRIKILKTDGAWKVYFLIWVVIATILTLRIRFAVYPCTVMLGFMLLFFRGKEIMNHIRILNPKALVSLLVISNTGG